jgi:hypothetical protein
LWVGEDAAAPCCDEHGEDGHSASSGGGEGEEKQGAGSPWAQLACVRDALEKRFRGDDYRVEREGSETDEFWAVFETGY